MSNTIEINSDTIDELSKQFLLPKHFVLAFLRMKSGEPMQSEFQSSKNFYIIKKEDGKLYECLCDKKIEVKSPKNYEILGKWHSYIGEIL